MMGGDVETYYQESSGTWRNRVGGSALFGEHDRRGDAIAQGRQYAISRRVEHVIRDSDGAVVARKVYGHD